MQDNIKLLEYVSNGDLPFKDMIRYQNKLRARDTAILALIIGAGISSAAQVFSPSWALNFSAGA